MSQQTRSVRSAEEFSSRKKAKSRHCSVQQRDVVIHINHNKIDNLLTKSEALKMLLEAGVDYKRAIKTVDLFSDSEAVALESKDRMEYLYPTSKDVEPNNNPVNKEVVE